MSEDRRRSETWMVVRRDGKIPGGWRVVQWGLSEHLAKLRALEYKRPHEAMRTDDLYATRTAALATQEAK